MPTDTYKVKTTVSPATAPLISLGVYVRVLFMPRTTLNVAASAEPAGRTRAAAAAVEKRIVIIGRGLGFA